MSELSKTALIRADGILMVKRIVALSVATAVLVIIAFVMLRNIVLSEISSIMPICLPTYHVKVAPTDSKLSVS